MGKRKKILMVIANRDFRDEEYFLPYNFFIKKEFIVETASTALGIAYGKLGGEAKVDLLLPNVQINDYQAIIFVGGPGAQKYFDDVSVHTLARSALKNNLVLGAICIAPVILAKAGVLRGRKATVWHSPLDKKAIQYLEEGGASYSEEKIVSDGQIITASGPEVAEEFARVIESKIP